MPSFDEAADKFVRDMAMHPPKIDRPKWDEVIFGMLSEYKRRATCLRLQTASVVVDEEYRFLGWGYNGAPRGMPHCLDVGCLMDGDHCVRTIHDTANALSDVGRSRAKGAHVIQLHRPCIRCVQMMVNYQIRYLTFWGSYATDDASAAMKIASEGGISVQCLGDQEGIWLPYSIRSLKED